MHRSYLYVPGDRPERFERALASGADAVIVDLEDGVVPAHKDAARAAVAELLATDRESPAEILVRINNDDGLAPDLAAVLQAGASAIYLPKADSASLERLDAELASLGLEQRAPAIVALVESARGLLDAAALGSHRLVRNLALGEADLSAELGVEPSPDARELWSVRSQVVVASAAAGLDPPTAGVNTDFKDLGALRDDTVGLRRAGFGARSAIHPAQVAVINDVFTPSADELGRAEDLVALFEESLARGEGTCVDEHGRMVDEAVVRSARRLLSRRTDR